MATSILSAETPTRCEDVLAHLPVSKTTEYTKGQMIYEVSKSLHEGHGVSSALYDEAVKMLGERGLVEIIGLCGYYTMVSMTLNTFEFDLPEGEVSDLG